MSSGAGRIITDHPDVMWGTDATRFYIEQDGWYGDRVLAHGQGAGRGGRGLDDWSPPLDQDQEQRDLLEVLQDRYGTRLTMVTSQVPPT